MGSDIAEDTEWGLDHGTWSVLVHTFPDADVPIVQLSLDMMKAPAEHYALAKRLAPLRSEGILIAGSGNIVHNLRVIRWGGEAPAYEWASRFHAATKGYIARGEDEPLITL